MNPEQRRLYEAVKGFFGWPFSTLLQLKVTGDGHVPASGGALLIANHASVLDPLVLGVSISRPIRFMAASFVFDLPLIGPLYRQLGAFPVDVTDGCPERGLEAAIGLLEAGELVGVFPEGLEHFFYPSTQKTLAPFHLGFAKILMALCRPVPVVPAAVAGFGRRFHLKIPPPWLAQLGKPFHFLETRLWGYERAVVAIGQPVPGPLFTHEPDPATSMSLFFREQVARQYLAALRQSSYAVPSGCPS